MKRNLWKKGLVFGIIALFLGMSIAPIANSMQTSDNIKTSKVIEDLELDNSVYVQPDKKLTQKHLVYLVKALPHIKDSKIKQAFRDIIAEIMYDGDATSDEIQLIIESNNVDASEVYILARVKTTDMTEGDVFCFPGLFRLVTGFLYLAKGIYLNYEWPSYSYPTSWNLHINGKLVNEGKGHIFGYFGFAHYTPGCPHYPGQFNVNGFGVFIFHHDF